MAKDLNMDIDNLYFSTLSGRGIYRPAEQKTVPFGEFGKAETKVLENILTNERYFIKYLSCSPDMLEVYRARIMNPPDRSCILWPMDMVEITEEHRPGCTTFVDNVYDELSKAADQRPVTCALTFSTERLSELTPGRRWLEENVPHEQRNWNHPKVRSMATKLVRALDKLNASGYLYLDFQPDRFLYTPDDTGVLDFSDLVFGEWELAGQEDAYARQILDLSSGRYPLEYAESALVQGKNVQADHRMQNYSLCAYLFEMLIGCKPYEGRLMESFPDRTRMEHYVKYREYHTNPLFVFQAENDENRLGTMNPMRDKPVIEAWNSASEKLKDIFSRVLDGRNAMREIEAEIPTPAQWCRLFEELGWNQSMQEG